MSSYINKPCSDCGGQKGPKYRAQKYCGRCLFKQKRIKAEKNHARNIARKYGITPRDYQDILDFQGGLCYLCRRATGTTRRLSVDHDHKTGQVRGLLCRPCNNILGHARDDPAFFCRAVEYLMAPPWARVKILRENDGKTNEH